MTHARRVLGDLTNSIGEAVQSSAKQQGHASATHQTWVTKLDDAVCNNAVERTRSPWLKSSHVEAADRCGSCTDFGIEITLCAWELLDFWSRSAQNGLRLQSTAYRFRTLDSIVSPNYFFSPPTLTQSLPALGAAWPPFQRNAGRPSEVAQSGPPKSWSYFARAFDDKENDTKDDTDSFCKLAVSGLHESQNRSEWHGISASSILDKFQVEERERILLWLFQVCATVNVHDSILYTSVLLLDRFISKHSAPVPNEQLQLVIVGVLSISLKFHGDCYERSKPPKLKDFLTYLGHHQFTAPQIFAMEHEILRCLGYSVSMPTAADFLDVYMQPLTENSSTLFTQEWCLSKFLLQLSLLDASLHYRHSPAILAAGAMYAALWCLRQHEDEVLLEKVIRCFNQHGEWSDHDSSEV